MKLRFEAPISFHFHLIKHRCGQKSQPKIGYFRAVNKALPQDLSERTKAYLQLHIAVLLFGFTAILGRLINLSELVIVWYRLMFTCLSLLFIPQVWRALSAMSAFRVWQLLAIGVVVSAHWVMFYGAVKYANVSVTLSCMATASFFTAIIEPLITNRRYKIYEILLGLLIVPGIYLIFYFSKIYTVGIVMGLLAALLAAVFASFNKRMVATQDALTMTFVELGGGFIFLTLVLPFYWQFFPGTALAGQGTDWLYLVILALLCTTFAYVLSIHALKQLTAFANAMTINLEPIYGILLAFIIFQENQSMDNRFYMGTGLVLLAVFLHPIIEYWLRKRKPVRLLAPKNKLD